MAYDETLAQRVRTALSARVRTEELRMFGGLAFTVNGHVCCGIVGHDLMLRVGPDRYAAALARPHARKMDFTGRPLKGMVYVGPHGLNQAPSLKSWLSLALEFVTTLQPKTNPPRTRRKTVAAKKTTAKKTAVKKSTARASVQKAPIKKAKASARKVGSKKGTKKALAKKSPAARNAKPASEKEPSRKPPAKAAAKKAPASKRPPTAQAEKKPSLEPPKPRSVPPGAKAAAKRAGRASIRPTAAVTPNQSLRPRSLLPIGPCTGFSKKTLRYLKDLAEHNDKTWFDEHRGHYESFYLQPALEFIAAIGPKLRTISPDVQFEARINGSLFRIQRDVRFSKDKTPYKAHIDLWFWHGDRKNWSTPGYFFRLEPKKLTVGGGTHRFDATQIQNYREAVVDAERGSELEQVLSEVAAQPRFTVGGATRSAVPRGFDPDHHRAPLLLHEGLYAAYEGPPPRELHEPSFVDWCAARFATLAPVVEWLLRL